MLIVTDLCPLFHGLVASEALYFVEFGRDAGIRHDRRRGSGSNPFSSVPQWELDCRSGNYYHSNLDMVGDNFWHQNLPSL